MKLHKCERNKRIRGVSESGYPHVGMAISVVLLFLAPFLSMYLVYPVFLICIYRMLKYDVKIFATDYCVLATLTTIFQTSGGMSLLIYVSLFAAVWYTFREGIRANAVLVFFLLLVNYLFLHMQMDISGYIMVVGQLYLLYILLPAQDAESAERACKAFCISLLVSSAYAFLFRNTAQMYALRGNEAQVFLGSKLRRFYGLFTDPNYYMVHLITAISVLLRLRDGNRISTRYLLLAGGTLLLFGLLTYSKTFLLCVILLIAVYILWQFRDRKAVYGSAIMVLIIIATSVMLAVEFTPLTVIAERFLSASNFNSLTTGRAAIYQRYWNKATESIASFMLGYGFKAPQLVRDPHNLYLEILYYFGAVGVILLAGFCVSMIREMHKKTREYDNRNFFSKYVVLIMLFVVFFTLHGIFSISLYAVFCVGFLSLFLAKQTEVAQI